MPPLSFATLLRVSRQLAAPRWGVCLLAGFIGVRTAESAPAPALAPAAPAPTVTAPVVITTFSQAYDLSLAEQSVPHPVRMELTAYYYDPEWRLLWGADTKGDVYAPLETTVRTIKPGQHFLVEGTMSAVSKGLDLAHSKITLLGEEEWPKPLDANGRFADYATLDGHFVVVDGYVNRQMEIDSTHLLLDLAVEGHPVQGRVKIAKNNPVPQVEGATIRCRAVYVGGVDAVSGALKVALWIPSERHVEFLSWLEDAPAFDVPVTPIDALPSVDSKTRVRIAGLVRSQTPGSSVVLRDETGQATLETAMTRPLKSGERVEAIGYPVHRGTTWILQQSLYRRMHAGVAAPAPRANGLPLLRLADQVRELRPEKAERGYPVALTGVVAWGDTHRCFLLDSSGGIEVMREADAIESIGGQISVRGVTIPGSFAPAVRATAIEPLDPAELPEARPITWEHAMTGVEAGQWVSLNGFVRSARAVPAPGPLKNLAQLELTTSGGEFTAVVAGEPNPAWLVGSSVRLSGVCSAITNAHRQLTGISLLVPDPAHIEIEEARPADLFAVPERSIASLRQFNTLESFIHRVRVKGVLINQVPGVSLNLQEESEGLLVLTNQTGALAPGDVLEVVGFPGRQSNRIVLREAVFRRIGHNASFAAVPVGRLGAIDPELDGRLIATEALLLDVSTHTGGMRLVCQSAGLVFEAALPSTEREPPVDWRPGAHVSIVGVYEIQYDDRGRAHALQLELRSANDVRVLHKAPWWNVTHALSLAAAFGLLILLGLGWVFALQHRVRRQTGQIREQMEKARNLEAELFRSSKLESLGVLAGGIAHDFNNLLTVVMGNISLVLGEKGLDDESRHSLRQSEKAALRARDLTQQLLTFSKGGAPVRTSVAVPEIVREAAGFASHGSNVRCDFDFAPDLWPADADKGQLAQVVHNIVINGIQAMTQGGVLQISACNQTLAKGEIATLAAGRYLKLSFADTGAGISAENLTRIFDPYFTTKKHGNGLGLATVYSIVNRHHGYLDVKSELGRGTTFRIWLPAAEQATDEKLAEPAVLPKRSGRVLVMDDEAGIRHLISTLLQRIGFRVTAVEDGAAALREYQRARGQGETFACVILDLTVPAGMGGAEAMAQLRQLDPDVCAIVSSGYSKDPVVANYRAHGFRGIMPKPYNVDDVVKVINSVVPA